MTPREKTLCAIIDPAHSATCLRICSRCHLRIMQKPIPIRGTPVAVQGEQFTVLAVTPDAVFLIGTYGKIVEVAWNESKEPMAA